MDEDGRRASECLLSEQETGHLVISFLPSLMLSGAAALHCSLSHAVTPRELCRSEASSPSCKLTRSCLWVGESVSRWFGQVVCRCAGVPGEGQSPSAPASVSSRGVFPLFCRGLDTIRTYSVSHRTQAYINFNLFLMRNSALSNMCKLTSSPHTPTRLHTPLHHLHTPPHASTHHRTEWPIWDFGKVRHFLLPSGQCPASQLKHLFSFSPHRQRATGTS